MCNGRDGNACRLAAAAGLMGSGNVHPSLLVSQPGTDKHSVWSTHRRQQLVVGAQVHHHQHLAIARGIHLLCRQHEHEQKSKHVLATLEAGGRLSCSTLPSCSIYLICRWCRAEAERGVAPGWGSSRPCV